MCVFVFPQRCGSQKPTALTFRSTKDGMWAVMAWLQILAKKTEAAGKLVSVEDSTKKKETIYYFIQKFINFRLKLDLLYKSCGRLEVFSYKG